MESDPIEEFEQKKQEFMRALEEFVNAAIRIAHTPRIQTPPPLPPVLISPPDKELTEEDWKIIFSWRCKYPNVYIREQFRKRNMIRRENLTFLERSTNRSVEKNLETFNRALSQNWPYRVQKIIAGMDTFYKIIRKKQ